MCERMCVNGSECGSLNMGRCACSVCETLCDVVCDFCV